MNILRRVVWAIRVVPLPRVSRWSQISLLPCIYINSLLPSLRHTILLCRLVPLLAFLGAGLPQRPADTSICDDYTTAFLKDNNATNQVALLVLVVNTAVIGNYSEVNVGIKVPGILTRDL